MKTLKRRLACILMCLALIGQLVGGFAVSAAGEQTAVSNTANMRLGESLDFYLYVPAGGKTYTLTSVFVGGREVTDAVLAPDGENYKIIVPVFAKEMADTVTVVLTDTDGHDYAVTDSVKDYARRILDTSESQTEKTMMTDMLVYGAAAQVYFDHNTAALATAGIDLSNATPALDLSSVYDPMNTSHPMAYHSANLTLEERIDFAMYFWTARIGNDKSYTYWVEGAEGVIADGNGTFSEILDGAEGYLYEVHIPSLNLSAMSEAVISLTYHDKDGNTYTAKDSMPNYLYRNEGLAISDAPQTYTLNADGSTQSEGAKSGTDGSELYAKIMAFAASCARYAEESDQPIGPAAPVEYTLVANDVIFIPGAAKSGVQSVGYILNSATLAAGTKVQITVPASNGNDANGSTPDSSANKASGYFWKMASSELYRAKGVWDSSTSTRAYKFGYHDKITAYTADSITLDHAAGHKSTGICSHNFSNACGDSSSNRYRECARKQNVNASTLILDLRAAVLAGAEDAVTTLAEIKALTDAGTALVNTYVPDGVSVGSSNGGTGSVGGTAAAIIVIDYTPTVEIISPEEAEQILAQRRDAAEAYMRRTMSVLWKMDQDFLYTTADNITPEQAPTTGLSRLLIKGGRIYRGTMYSYASGTMDAFLEYAVGEPENGVYTIANLPWEAVSGGSSNGARVGNDCTSSIGLAWGSIGVNSITIANSKTMGPSKGYLRVGEYESSDTDNTHSENITAANGEQVMYAAYAQLKKADAIVHRDASSGHGIMIVSSNPVYKQDGTINGKTSTVTVLEQGRGAFKNESHYYDAKLKSEVYYFGGLDNVYTYEYLMKGGYLPVTCREFIDPSPIGQPIVKDSCKDPLSKDTLLTGTISCNWMIDSLTMTITDEVGAVVQKGALRSTRTSNYSTNLQRFKTEKPTGILGRIAPEELAAGNYHCKLVCRLVSGQEFTMRNFDFTV